MRYEEQKGIMKTIEYISFTVILCPLLIGSGCASDYATSSSANKITIVSNDTTTQNAEVQLADAATSVSKSLQQLAEIERASHPQAKLPSPPVPEMIGMAQLASIEWTGPVGPLVEKIAAASHYKVRTLGHPPAIPILVAISAKSTPLADILRDATFQCGSKANIVVYPASKTIELRYANARA
jgi:defect-in-organelle-trafficking protein DotD